MIGAAWAAQIPSGGLLATIDWTHPVVMGAVGSALTVLVTKALDLWAASKDKRDTMRGKDRETLSADETSFRKDIIIRYQQCLDALAAKDVIIFALQKETVVLREALAYSKVENFRLRKDMGVAVEQGVTAVKDAADQLHNIIDEGK